MKLVSKAENVEQPVSHDPGITKRVMLKSGEVPGVLQWATSSLLPGMKVSEHKHDDAREFFYILSGSMEVWINDHRHTLSQGSKRGS